MKKTNLKDAEEVEALPGIFRKTLAFNDEVMVCHFHLKKGAKIPLHEHRASQNGFVISGKAKFFTETTEFLAEAGESYVFGPHEKHGCDVMEDTFIIEAFAPSRPEYAPKSK